MTVCLNEESRQNVIQAPSYSSFDACCASF